MNRRVPHCIAALATTLLSTPSMIAQTDRTHAPAPGPAPIVHVGASKDFTLPTGMRVILVENHKLPLVSVQMRFDHAPFRQGDICGYQDLAGELLTSGTGHKTKAQIDELVDGMGAQLNGSADGLYASCLKKNFDKLMNLMYEVITNATYPPPEFEKAKKRSLSGLKSRAADPDQIAELVGRALTFGKVHPYGEVTTEATLNKVTRSNVFAYYQRFFRPENAYLVFVGDVTEEEARAGATRFFGDWKGATIESTKDERGNEVVRDLGPIIHEDFEPVANKPTQICFVDRPGSAQSVIKAVFPVALKPNDPMALDAQVLNTILGGGVFNARLMQNLREDKAFTYGAYSSIDADRWCGNFSAGCSVRNTVTDSAVTEILYEIAHITEQPVKADELSLAKSYMAGSFARSLEDPRTIARFALNTFLYGLPKDHYSTYLQRLDTVNIASVQTAAKRFLKPDNTTVLVVGDKEQVANKLAPLSTTKGVLYFDINGDTFRETAELPPANMKADDVIDAYLKAIGGRGALAQVKDLRKEYTAELMDRPITMTEQIAEPDKYAMRMSVGPTVMQQQVFDGARGKAVGPEGKKDLADQELESVKESGYAFPEMHYHDLDYKLTLNGIVDVSGSKAYRIVIQTAADRMFTEYYDVKTGLKLRRTENQNTDEGNFQVITDLKDYKAVDGIFFPHLIEQSAGTNFSFVAKSIEVNKGIDPSVFKVE